MPMNKLRNWPIAISAAGVTTVQWHNTIPPPANACQVTLQAACIYHVTSVCTPRGRCKRHWCTQYGLTK